MAKFTLSIDLDGAAFHIQSNGSDNGEFYPWPELVPVLRAVIAKVEDQYAEGIVGDSNGNTVGHYRITGLRRRSPQS